MPAARCASNQDEVFIQCQAPTVFADDTCKFGEDDYVGLKCDY